MNANIEIKAIQLIQINMYRLSAFPEDRIKNLISELNVHYDKINNYIESEVSGEKINIEVIDSLSKLNEIFRLAPLYRISHEHNSGDFRFGVDILESVIALLNTEAGHRLTRQKLLDFGWNLLNKLYNFSFDDLVYQSLLYRWLKNKNLIRTYNVTNYRRYHEEYNHVNQKIRFEPSGEELEQFYKANQQKIYEYMVFYMNGEKEERDPLSGSDEGDYYHYFKSLKNIKI